MIGHGSLNLYCAGFLLRGKRLKLFAGGWGHEVRRLRIVGMLATEQAFALFPSLHSSIARNCGECTRLVPDPDVHEHLAYLNQISTCHSLAWRHLGVHWCLFGEGGGKGVGASALSDSLRVGIGILVVRFLFPPPAIIFHIVSAPASREPGPQVRAGDQTEPTLRDRLTRDSLIYGSWCPASAYWKGTSAA